MFYARETWHLAPGYFAWHGLMHRPVATRQAITVFVPTNLLLVKSSRWLGEVRRVWLPIIPTYTYTYTEVGMIWVKLHIVRTRKHVNRKSLQGEAMWSGKPYGQVGTTGQEVDSTHDKTPPGQTRWAGGDDDG